MKRVDAVTTKPVVQDDQQVESRRLDWMIANSGAQCEKTKDGTHYINAWVCNGEPGNEMHGGGKFTASGKTHRECIDKFLAGDIKRFN